MLDSDRGSFAADRRQTPLIPYLARSPIEAFHIRTILRHLPLVATVILMSLLAAGAVALLKARSYESSVQVILENRQLELNQQDALVASAAIDAATLQSQIELIRSERTAVRVASELGLASRPMFQPRSSLTTRLLSFLRTSLPGQAPESQAEIDRRIGLSLLRGLSVTRLGGSYILDVSFRSTDPSLSAEVANAFVQRYIESRTELNREASQSATARLRDRIQLLGLTATVVYPAAPALTPVGPGLGTILAIGFVVGLILALALALLMEILDDRIRRREDVERLTSAELFGSLPRLGASPTADALSSGDRRQSPGARGGAHGGGRASERRSLFNSVTRRIVVGLNDAQGGPVILGVTSVRDGAGVTTVAAEVARIMAGTGRKVLVADCHPTAPQLTAAFAPNATVGIEDCLAGRVPLEQAILRGPGFDILPARGAGKAALANEDLWLGSLPQLLETAKLGYDHVVLDLPSVVPSSYVRACAPVLDQLLLVIESDGATVREAHDAIATLGGAEDVLAGVVINHPTHDASRWGRVPMGRFLLPKGQRRRSAPAA